MGLGDAPLGSRPRSSCETSVVGGVVRRTFGVGRRGLRRLGLTSFFLGRNGRRRRWGRETSDPKTSGGFIQAVWPSFTQCVPGCTLGEKQDRTTLLPVLGSGPRRCGVEVPVSDPPASHLTLIPTPTTVPSSLPDRGPVHVLRSRHPNPLRRRRPLRSLVLCPPLRVESPPSRPSSVVSGRFLLHPLYPTPVSPPTTSPMTWARSSRSWFDVSVGPCVGYGVCSPWCVTVSGGNWLAMGTPFMVTPIARSSPRQMTE